MSDLVHALPAAGVAAFLAVGFVWRPLLQYRRSGHSGYVLFRTGRPAQHLRDALFVLLLFGVTAQAAALAAAPDVLDAAGLRSPDPGPAQLAVGVLLLFGGTVLMAAAQLHLGASWRIGIEEGARPGLVTGGLYRVCRNPIFLGMFTTLAGLAVLQPTWLFVAAFVGAVVGVRMQVLEEEAYLLRTYGDEYRTFARRVGRFLPGLGLIR